MSDFRCGAHRAYIRPRGGGPVIAELTPLSAVVWERVRDEVSSAHVTVPTTECCDVLEDLRCIIHELHITRNGLPVWQGPITRIEYEWDDVQVHAEDVLWVTKRTVVKAGYNHAYPNMTAALDVADELLRQQTYLPHGDPWKVVPHLHPLYNPAGNDPKTSRVVHRYQLYVYDDFDGYAEDRGIDYVVVNRDVYYHDTHLARWELPDLDEQWISEFPRITEYGNQLATQAVVADGRGYGVVVQGGGEHITTYGYIDHLTSLVDDEVEIDEDPPTPDELLEWGHVATRSLSNRAPSPVSVVIPANTTLLPGAPWEIEDLIPGSWFKVRITRMCRHVDEWQKLDQVIVTEQAPAGETVNFSASTAPVGRIDPTP